MKWVRYLGTFLGASIVVAIVGLLIAQRVSDGPMAFVQGGPFRTGEVVTAPVTDWTFATKAHPEFELVGFGTSRIAGIFLHDGVPYFSCDLGYMWARFEPPGRYLLHLIYIFKHWHTDAVQDGRVRIRMNGKIYEGRLVLVEDPALNLALRADLEELARGYIAPAELGPAPTEPPNDIWFFRVEQ